VENEHNNAEAHAEAANAQELTQGHHEPKELTPSFQQEGPPEQQQDWQHDSQDSCQASEAFCVADKVNDFNADALPDELNENLWLSHDGMGSQTSGSGAFRAHGEMSPVC
jgi:hypothetical protein